jgi:hypothetical protein
MKKSIFFILALSFATSALWAGASVDHFTASSSGDHIVVRWRATYETQMQRYEIYRKSKTTDYSLVYTQLPTGSGSQYEYVDMPVGSFHANGTSSITAENYTYLLKIIAADGTSQLETSVSYQASTSKRTWGSIKAIFR